MCTDNHKQYFLLINQQINLYKPFLLLTSVPQTRWTRLLLKGIQCKSSQCISHESSGSILL